MKKTHCDLCDRVIPKIETVTNVIWEEVEMGVHVKKRYEVEICNDCIELLRKKGRLNVPEYENIFQN